MVIPAIDRTLLNSQPHGLAHPLSADRKDGLFILRTGAAAVATPSNNPIGQTPHRSAPSLATRSAFEPPLRDGPSRAESLAEPRAEECLSAVGTYESRRVPTTQPFGWWTKSDYTCPRATYVAEAPLVSRGTFHRG